MKAIALLLLIASFINSGWAADSHGEPIDIYQFDVGAPHAELKVVQDNVKGFNVKLEVEDFTLAPLKAGQEFVAPESGGQFEGHAHLYVVKTKDYENYKDYQVARIYGSYHYPEDLEPGVEYLFIITLHANSHNLYVNSGTPLEAYSAITPKAKTDQPDHGGHDHDHQH